MIVFVIELLIAILNLVRSVVDKIDKVKVKAEALRARVVARKHHRHLKEER